MAVPELVFCSAGGAGYASFPGGVFAVCAADHLAGARGTLSTEADALSAGGTVVRDTQQVNDILVDSDTAYQAADDTLEITGVPFLDGRTYDVWATLKTEGYTDVTDGPLLRTGFNENWVNAGVVGLHTTSEASNQRFATSPPPMPYYRALYVGFKLFNTGDSYFFRMASESGTTIEWLLDQLIFIVSPNNDATVVDNTEFRGFGVGDTTLNTTVTVIDGADGGDDNGKFTWFPRDPPDLASPGDFQRYADGDDAEYFSEVTTDDGLTFWSTGDEQGPAWMYSCHTAEFRGERTWSDDTFDNRNTSGGAGVQDMGVSPEGFGYRIGSSANSPPNEAFVDGAGQAILRVGQVLGTIQIDWGNASVGSGSTDNQGMRYQLYDQHSWDTVWEWTNGTDAVGFVRIILGDGTAWDVSYIEFDIPSGTWRIVHPVSGPGPDHDISAWFGMNSPVGVRFEVVRYVIRARVWDASGAEPGTWDEEQFLEYSLGSNLYPYGDNTTKSSRVNDPYVSLTHYVEHTSPFAVDLPFEVTITKNTVTHDPYGDPEDMTARFYRPPATSLGDQIVPFGTSYFVYWGQRDWTDAAFGSDYLEYSLKVWNDPAAAEIQRAEVVTYYFFWYQQGGIISMNWRSSDRQTSARRVLVGTR